MVVTPMNVSAAATWGGAAALTALWLVQPFDWLKQQLGLEEPPAK